MFSRNDSECKVLNIEEAFNDKLFRGTFACSVERRSNRKEDELRLVTNFTDYQDSLRLQGARETRQHQPP